MRRIVRARALSSSQDNTLTLSTHPHPPIEFVIPGWTPILRRFPRFRELPHKALRIVFQQLDALHIFELSQVSTEVTALINPDHHTFDHIEVNISRKKKSIKFCNNWQTIPALNFNFNSTSSIFKRSVKFGDLRLPIKYDPETAYTCSTDNYEDCLQPCLDLFATIFSCRGGIAIVNLNECSLNVREHTAHRIFNKNLVVKLCGDVQNLGTNNGSLQSFYPEYVLLEGIVADFHFLEEEFDPYEMFTRNRVSIMDAKWVTLYHLKSLKFIWLVLYNSMLTERDVNEFIKLWLDGKWLQLHRFEIRHTSRGGFDLEVLKSGLNVKKWNKNLRNGCYIMDSHENPYLLDTRKDLDVIKSDGTLATIVNRPDTFRFIVWPDPPLQLNYRTRSDPIADNF